MSRSSEEELQKLRMAIASVAKQSPRTKAERRGSPGISDDDAPPECDDGPDARELALRLLTRREHGAGELVRKLQQRGVPRAEAQEAIAEMAEQGWQSDERFAAQFAADHAARGDGPLKIRAALQARGVYDGPIAQALDELDADWLDLARQAHRKRFGTAVPKTPDDQARQIRFLMTRGFPASIARQVVRSHDFNQD
ncbi:MAG: regulatory protein RecX [Pseudomonadota bacterium]